MSETRLIVGLGNPGKKYEQTRHNLGFRVIQKLAAALKWTFKSSSFTKAVVSQGRVQEKDVWLLCPLTYMNHSGISVKEAVIKNDVQMEQLLVVCDDFNLDFGQIRLKAQGSDGGHNGLGSVIERLGTDQFSRLRLGIGQPPKGEDVADFVLEEFNASEQKHIDELVAQAVKCCQLWLNKGINKAMETYNRRK